MGKEIIISGASKPKTPVELPNTLKSVAKGHILDLIGYGPVKGLVGDNPLKSVYLDDTPIMNPDGSRNFSGIGFEFRYGDPEQTVMKGFNYSAAPRDVNTQVKYNQPISRTTSVPEIDALEITVSLPALYFKDMSGNVGALFSDFTFKIWDAEGNLEYDRQYRILGKNTAPYEKTYRFELTGKAPFTIEMNKLTVDIDNSHFIDDLYWARMTEIISVKHSYPNMVMAGIAVDAEYFGGSLPSRKYLMDLSIIKVPSNYNPETREYDGIWDGTFKMAWTDNPAWCYYDLATHPIIGAGIANVNKWALYEIAKYCDELVDDGFGGKEPRFTCNTVFSSSEDAITALTSLATVFRGISFWNSNELLPVADMPTPVRKIITPSDVIDGDFIYEGTSLKDRHSVIVVNWIDPDDGYREKPERIEDPASLELLGWKEKEIRAIACTSRGQARRLGLWMMYSEKEESDTVAFSVPLKHADLRPGDCFYLQDPLRAGVRLGGRVAEIEGLKVTLDFVDEENPVQIKTGWHILLQTESGGMVQRRVIAVNGRELTLNQSVVREVIVGASFSITSPEVATPIFKVASVREKADAIFEISAAPHDPAKYDRIEKGIAMPELPESFIPTGVIKSPKHLNAVSYSYEDGNSRKQGISVGWTAPDDPRSNNYVLEARGPDDITFHTVYVGPGVSHDLRGVEPGRWAFRVRVSSENWGHSPWLEKEFVFDSEIKPAEPIDLMFSSSVSSIGVYPVAPSPYYEYEFEFYRSEEPLALPMVESNAKYLGAGRSIVDQGLKFDTRYYYFVRGVNLHGYSDFVSGNYKTTDNYDDLLEHILDEHQNSEIGKFFQEEIMKISGDGPGSVHDRLTPLLQRLEMLDIDFGDLEHSLNDKIEILQMQMSLFSDAPEWNPLEEYAKDAIVKWEGNLFTAKEAIPIGEKPSVFEGWHKIGDYTSMSDGISDLALRVSQAETTVKEVEGIVTPMASQLNSLAAMWREDDEGESELEGALEGWDSLARFTEQVKVEASERQSLVERLTAFEASLGDSSANLSRLEQALVDESQALAQQIEALDTLFEGELETVKASIEHEAIARSTADEALALKTDNMQVEFQNEFDQLSAGLNSEILLRADQTSALATQLDTTQASLGNTSATVQEHVQAIADIESGLNASWGIKVATSSDGKPVVAGIGLEVANNAGGEASSTFTIQANRFVLVNNNGLQERTPFVVLEDGTTILDQAVIGEYISSKDYVPNTQGWIIHRGDGTPGSSFAEFNGTLNVQEFRYFGALINEDLFPSPKVATHGGVSLGIDGFFWKVDSKSQPFTLEQRIPLGPISSVATIDVRCSVSANFGYAVGKYGSGGAQGVSRISFVVEYYLKRTGWVTLENYQRSLPPTASESLNKSFSIPTQRVNGEEVIFRVRGSASVFVNGDGRGFSSAQVKVTGIKLESSVFIRRV